MNTPLPLRAVALIGLLSLLCFVPVAHAQSTEAAPESAPVWVRNLGPQINEGLTSSSEAVRNNALNHLAYFAYFYDDVDWSDALPTLLDIYKNDESEQCRLMAVAALHAIGDESAMQDLRHAVELDFGNDASMRLELVTLAALADFYGTGTFKNDDHSAKLASSLVDYYLNPRVIVEPPIMIGVEQ